MHPVFFQLGPFTIYSYGLLVAAGVLFGLWYARRRAPRVGLNPNRTWNLGIYMVFGALVISKLWLFASDWNFYRANPGEILSISTLQSAGTFYGGVAGALLTLAVYTYFERIPVLSVLDLFAAAAPLAHAIGRIGCFAAGCCYGRPTSVPWAVTFTSNAAGELAGTPLHTALHPTQLYEAGAELLNFLLLVWLGARQRFTGQMLGTYFILYGIERGIIEFFRGDPGRTMLFHDTVSLMQIVSLGLIVTGTYLWWRGLRRMGLIAATETARAVASQ